MNGKKKLTTMYVKMGVMALIMAVIEVFTIIHWLIKGNWIPFAIGILIVIPFNILREISHLLSYF